MAIADVTIDSMAKKRSNPAPAPEDAKPPKPATYDLFARIDPAIRPALEEYVKTVRPRTDKSAVVELAIQEHLAKHGFWPWPPPADAGGE